MKIPTEDEVKDFVVQRIDELSDEMREISLKISGQYKLPSSLQSLENSTLIVLPFMHVTISTLLLCFYRFSFGGGRVEAAELGFHELSVLHLHPSSASQYTNIHTVPSSSFLRSFPRSLPSIHLFIPTPDFLLQNSKAHKALTSSLTAHGFLITTPKDLPTAFIATYTHVPKEVRRREIFGSGNGNGKERFGRIMGYNSEYDGLKGIGQGM